jgi:hypothetical protein
MLTKCSVLFYIFCGQKDSVQRIFIKKCFLFTVGSVCRVKWFTTGSSNSLKDTQKPQVMPDQVQKQLREWSKGFYAAGFNASTLAEDMSRNFTFYILYSFVTCLLALPHISLLF